MFISIIVTISNTVFVFASENREEKSAYQNEINKALIGGCGTVEDPFILDYHLAPEFKIFVENSWKIHSGSVKSGFVTNCLINDEGTFSNSAVWIYSYGGMSVSSDGNIRIKRVSYLTKNQAAVLAATVNYQNVGSILWDGFASYVVSHSKAQIASFVVSRLASHNITSIGSYSANTIGNSIAGVVGAAANIYGYVRFVQTVVNALMNVPLNSAVSHSKSFVPISYITSYHGSWYEYTVGEPGWNSAHFYSPDNMYGYGNMY